MSEELWSAVDTYLDKLLLQPDAVLAAALAASTAAGLPAISVSPPQGKLLMLLAELQGAGDILEIGTLGGYSTICLARGLAPENSLVTLELEPEYAEVARANIVEAGLADRVIIRVGPAADSLKELVAKRQEPFGLIFIDADKGSYPAYLEYAVRLSGPGTLIVADNVVRKGAVLDSAASDPNVRGVRRFLELVAADSRLCATVLQTVGSKGYDGFALIRVNAV